MVVSYKQLFEETFDSHIFGGSTFNLVPIGHKRNCLKNALDDYVRRCRGDLKMFCLPILQAIGKSFFFCLNILWVAENDRKSDISYQYSHVLRYYCSWNMKMSFYYLCIEVYKYVFETSDKIQFQKVSKLELFLGNTDFQIEVWLTQFDKVQFCYTSLALLMLFSNANLDHFHNRKFLLRVTISLKCSLVFSIQNYQKQFSFRIGLP